jgi:pimeloyl-ACP methyl ester carboxylesterase
MTLDRLIDGAIEVAEHLRSRLSEQKIILVGQSWGSFLGVHVIRRRPDLFHAFVGTGQLVSFVVTVASQVQWARQRATEVGDAATLKALDDAAALPENCRGAAEASAAKRWLLMPPDRTYAKMIYDFMGPKPYPARGDVADWIAGPDFSGSKLETVITTMDVRELGLDMSIPFLLFKVGTTISCPLKLRRPISKTSAHPPRGSSRLTEGIMPVSPTQLNLWGRFTNSSGRTRYDLGGCTLSF